MKSSANPIPGIDDEIVETPLNPGCDSLSINAKPVSTASASLNWTSSSQLQATEDNRFSIRVRQ